MEEQVKKKDFVHFVNRIYYINSHLAERLDELRSSPLFTHFQKEIAAAIILLELQISQINNLFDELGVVSSLADCAPMIAFLESVFTTIQGQENNTPYLSLLDYVSTADCVLDEGAKLAKLSQVPELNMSEYQLHDPLTLNALKASLYDNCVVN